MALNRSGNRSGLGEVFGDEIDGRAASQDNRFTKLMTGAMSEAVSAGVSIGGVSQHFINLNYKVKFYLEVMNYTKCFLEPSGVYTVHFACLQ